MYSYLDLLALIGIGSAHPGGFTLTKQLLQQFPITQGARVLDAGCGTGRTAAYIAKTYGCHVTAIDNHSLMLQKAAERMKKEGVKVELLQGTIEQLPFTNHDFSAVLSESVVAFTNINQTLKELYRVLQTNGMLLLLEMTVERPLAIQEQLDIKRLYGVKDILTEQEWQNRLHNAGFSHVQSVGGGTIATQIPSYAEQPDWNVSTQIDPSIYQIWAQHEAMIYNYCHLLGHRVFLCLKN